MRLWEMRINAVEAMPSIIQKGYGVTALKMGTSVSLLMKMVSPKLIGEHLKVRCVEASGYLVPRWVPGDSEYIVQNRIMAGAIMADLAEGPMIFAGKPDIQYVMVATYTGRHEFYVLAITEDGHDSKIVRCPSLEMAKREAEIEFRKMLLALVTRA